MPEPGQDLDPLWIRYIDWCSAQVARRFIALSPDEIWSQASNRPDRPARNSVLQLARALTVQIYEELKLPSFDDWRVSYLEDPARFNRDIVGYPAPRTIPEETPR